MNIKLSCSANRKTSKNAFVIEKDGRIVDKQVFTARTLTLNYEALEAVRRGLLSVRGTVTHDDLLLIEVQNFHLENWLNEQQESENYRDILIEIFAILDSIDCKYIAKNVKSSLASSLAETGEIDKIKLVGVLDGLE